MKEALIDFDRWQYKLKIGDRVWVIIHEYGGHIGGRIAEVEIFDINVCKHLFTRRLKYVAWFFRGIGLGIYNPNNLFKTKEDLLSHLSATANPHLISIL